MRKLKYGIIGLGGIGMEKHLPEYAKLKDDVEIVAACDICDDNLTEAAKRFDLQYKCKDYKELLAIKEVDFVSVCLPNYLHSPVTVDSLLAGKHVHCEKPMAINAAEAQKMLEAKYRSGKKLMIGLNNRFTPYSRYVKKIIEEKMIGDIYFVKCGWVRRNGLPHSGWFVDGNKSGGGALIDLGVHYIDLVMHFMDYPEIKSITGRTYNRLINSEKRSIYYSQDDIADAGKISNVEDLAAGFIELKNDVSIQFEINWASNIEKEMSFYDIYGSDGGIRFVKFPGKEPELRIYTVICGKHVNIAPEIKSTVYDECEFRDFIGCIRENREPRIAPPEQSVRMMEIIDAIYASAVTKKQIVF